MEQSLFQTLNGIDCSAHTEKKNGLTYLSWAWAWAEVKKICPDASYTIYENAQGWNYHTDGRTCWVKTGVTLQGLEHIEYLPVMDYRNASIPADNVTSFDVNRAIQRSLTKACARHGLGLYIYAGEDLPEEAAIQQQQVAFERMQSAVQLCFNTNENAQNWFKAEYHVGDIAEFTAAQWADAYKRLVGWGLIKDVA